MTRLPPRDRGLGNPGHLPEDELIDLQAVTNAANAVHTPEHMRQRILLSSNPRLLSHAVAYNVRMLNPDDIARLAKAYGGQTGLAAAAGVTQPTVSRWLKGAMPDPPQEARLRELMAEKAMLTNTPDRSLPESQTYPATGIRHSGLTMPVYAAAEGGPGVMVISTEPINRVERPWYLGTVHDGYAVLVIGDSMSPAYEEGDMAIINPRLPPKRGKPHIFTSGEQADGEFRGTIKKLIGQTATEWKVLQHNPFREFVLDKAEWPKALQVVGKLEG